MANEIELKLALPESAQRAFLRHPVLPTAAGRSTAQLVNIYYDTPDLALQKSGIAVRLRRRGRSWLQTVKCAGSSAGGLSARPEWETPYGGHFDFSGIDDEAVRGRLEKRSVLPRLTPMFETSFRRTTWNFGDVLLMFDRGWIAADGRREAISELELELAGGGVDALFELAWTLAERLPLLPAPLSKAERGIRLHLGTVPAPARATEIPLAPEMPPRAAFPPSPSPALTRCSSTTPAPSPARIPNTSTRCAWPRDACAQPCACSARRCRRTSRRRCCRRCAK
jgi:inorganic triphosphatase YgiF